MSSNNDNEKGWNKLILRKGQNFLGAAVVLPAVVVFALSFELKLWVCLCIIIIRYVYVINNYS